MKRLTLRIPDELARWIEIEAEACGLAANRLIEIALTDWALYGAAGRKQRLLEAMSAAIAPVEAAADPAKAWEEADKKLYALRGEREALIPGTAIRRSEALQAGIVEPNVEAPGAGPVRRAALAENCGGLIS